MPMMPSSVAREAALAAGKAGQLGVESLRELGRRRRPHRELGGHGVLHRREGRRTAGEALVDRLGADRAAEVKRVVTRRRRKQPGAIVAGRAEPGVGVEGRLEREGHRLTAEDHGDVQRVAEIDDGSAGAAAGQEKLDAVLLPGKGRLGAPAHHEAVGADVAHLVGAGRRGGPQHRRRDDDDGPRRDTPSLSASHLRTPPDFVRRCPCREV